MEEPREYIEIDLRCFLTKARNNYTHFGYQGFIGLAPLKSSFANLHYEQYSFLYKLREYLKPSTELAFRYNIRRDHDLGLNYGELDIFSTNQSGSGIQGYKYSASIPLPLNEALHTSLEATTPEEAIDNKVVINLGNYIRSVQF